MNKIDKPQKKPGKNKKFLNSLKLCIAMSLAVTLGNDVFSQKNTDNSIKMEYKINKTDVEKYQSMVDIRDKYISQTDNTYMDPYEYFVLNQKKLFLKSYELNRENTKTYVDKIKETLNKKFNIKTGDNPVNIIKLALETVSNRKDMLESETLFNYLGNEFDEKLINAYGYIQSMFPEIWKEVGGEKLPTWRLDGETLKRILYLLENGEYVAQYQDELNNNVGYGNVDLEDEDDGYIDLSDLNGDEDKEESDEFTEENDNKKEDIIEDEKIDEESSIENNNEEIQEDNGYIDLSDLKGDQNKEESDESIEENDNKKEDIIEDEKIDEESSIENNNEEIQEDDGYIDLSDLNGDKNNKESGESDIESNENNNKVEKKEGQNQEKTQENLNQKETLNLEKEIQNWTKEEVIKKISELGNISYEGDTINILLYSPNYKSIIKNNLESNLGPFLQSINKIEFIENKEEVTNIKLERKNIKIVNIDESMSIKYDFNYELKQDLPLSKQKEKIIKLMDTYPIINDFIIKLKKTGIDIGQDYGINRTSAILRAINGNFKAGNQMLDLAIESETKGSDVVGQIILQSWAMDLDLYQLNLIYNNFQNSKDIDEQKLDEKKILPVNEEMFELNKKEQEILAIVNDMSWTDNILSQNLSKEKINGISYQEIIDVVNGFKSPELQKVFMFKLLNNDIIGAQNVIGMELNCHERYPEYKAGNKIGKTELENIKKLGKTRRYMDQKNILTNQKIPQDVKTAYEKFVNGEFNNKGKSYSIISKTDFNIYLFSKNHHLLSRQNILIGSEVGDHPNNPMSGFRTTPGGLYETGNKFEKSQNNEMFFDKYGTHYIVLIPLNGQYDMTEKYTMGIHGTYEKDPSRDFKIKSENSKDRRTSNGCINLEDATFGEIYNHLILGSTLYITNEPSNQDIEKFLTKNK